jgi:hypothetical protein
VMLYVFQSITFRHWQFLVCFLILMLP